MSTKVKLRVLANVRWPVFSSLLWAGLWASSTATLTLPTQPAHAAETGGKNRNAAAADRLMAQGAAAITAKDFAAAQTALLEGYRTYQSPLILYHLGALRAAEQKTVEAQDLLRRFLADSTVEPGEPLRQEAQKLLASLPAAEAGEVQLAAPRGAEVLVDGTIVGAMPLPLPLLLTVGTHQITILQGKWRAASQAKVKNFRLLELRFKAGSDVVVATEPPTVLIIDNYPEPALQDPLRQRLLGVIRRENMAALFGSIAIGNARELGPAPACLADPACQRRLAEKFGSDYLLTAQVTRSPGDAKSMSAQLELYDLMVGATAATGSTSCSACTPDAAGTKLGEAANTLFNSATNRGRGELAITSEPAAAEVLLDGKPVGMTPLKKTIFAGTYELTIKKPNLRPQTQQLVVGSGGDPMQVAVTLLPEGVEPPPPVPTPDLPKRRPRWRLATGGAAIGVGALFTGFGLSALAVDGQCVFPGDASMLFPANCRDGMYFTTQSPGIGLSIAGLVLMAGGVVLVALPASIGGERVPASPAKAQARAANKTAARAARFGLSLTPGSPSVSLSSQAGPGLGAF